jgi:putative transcriptional regulator
VKLRAAPLAFLLLASLAYAQSPARGKFLVAARTLVDPNFSETVVLLVDHGEEGSWGLVINRPTAVPLSKLFPEEKALQKRDDHLFSGGPVSPGRFLLLVRSPRPPENSRPVFAEVHLASSPAVLRGPDARVITEFRAYAGYSGWAPGQLETEIARGDWYILTAEAAAVFAEDPALVWATLHTRAYAPVAFLPARPLP